MTHMYGGPVWVNAPDDLRRGAQALEALQTANDIKYWQDETGIIKVDYERWTQAQRYEEQGWLKFWTDQRDDRSQEHIKGFNNYQQIPQDLGNVIEVGCGPFTQLQFIIKGRTAKSITLLDPLIYRYVHNPYCFYRQGNFQNLPTTFISSMLEELKDTQAYDTLICINVLEHVCDAAIALRNIYNALKPNGLVIFCERSYDQYDVTTTYDVGHPIRVKDKVLAEFKSQFKPTYQNGNYFIGNKLEPTSN